MDKPHLISFKTCPFVQRAVLVLEEKGVDYDVTFIDLRNKPDWFLKISPRGKVPVLQVEGVNLFESQAISEYLDEVYPDGPLMPADAVGRARDRAWFGFASEEIFFPMYRLMTAKEPEARDKELALIASKLERVEEALVGDWLSGDGARFGMADVAFAPFFTRAALLESQGAQVVPLELTRVKAWGERILARPSLSRSVPEDYTQVELGYLKANGSAVLQAA